jgi:hypothetical protein
MVKSFVESRTCGKHNVFPVGEGRTSIILDTSAALLPLPSSRDATNDVPSANGKKVTDTSDISAVAFGMWMETG